MRITVVTPSYNQSEYIGRTIESVINQKGDFSIEYIIMDGGSNDGTVDILKEYEEKLKGDKRISFKRVSEKDKGQSDAINKGLRIATGDIVTYLNSDDTLADGALHLVVNELGKSEKKWSYGKCRIIDKEDKEIRKYITRYKNLLGRRYSYSRLLSENFISQMTVFWKREIMDELGYFDENEHLCMDYEYWLRIGEKYEPLYIPKYIANFRFYYTSKSGAHFDKQFKDELRIAKKYAKGKYKWSILMHKFNYYKIIWSYKVLSFIKK